MDFRRFKISLEERVQLVIWRLLTGKVLFQSQICPCRLCDGHGGTGTDSCPATAVLSCHFHSVNVPFSVHMPAGRRTMGPLKAMTPRKHIFLPPRRKRKGRQKKRRKGGEKNVEGKRRNWKWGRLCRCISGWLHTTVSLAFISLLMRGLTCSDRHQLHIPYCFKKQ
jgi:hypothetical protein